MPDRPRFYADAHIASAVIRALRQKGVDILGANDVGLREAPDDEQLAFAEREQRVLVSRDNDFLGLHAAGVHHAGILRIGRTQSIGAIIEAISLVHALLTIEEMMDRMEYF